MSIADRMSKYGTRGRRHFAESAQERFEKGFLPDRGYTPSTEDIVNGGKGRPSHGYDHVFDDPEGPISTHRRRDFYPGPVEMPIYDPKTGDPTGKHFVVGEPIGPLTDGYSPPDWVNPSHRLNQKHEG